MPRDIKPDEFDAECETCGRHGMKKTQTPAPGGPAERYKCPECGSTQPIGEYDGGSHVSKR